MSTVQVWTCAQAMIIVAGVAGAQLPGPQPLPDNPRPQIPKAAIADAVIGFADLSVSVKPDGKPGSIRIVNAAPRDFGFEKEAKEVMSRWRFAPVAGTSKAERIFTTRFNFRPSAPLPIALWLPQPGANVSLPESGQSVLLKTGWIRTRRWFSDFVLDTEFRLLETGTDAGLLIHAQRLEDGSRLAYRVNLIDEKTESAAFGRIDGGKLTSREVSFDQSASAAGTPLIGKWQTLRVESTNGTVRVMVNGVLVSSTDQLIRLAGHIGLEVTRGALEVRRAMVERRDTYLDRPDPGKTAAVASPASGITSPLLQDEIKPEYSEAAMRARIEGVVTIDAVVLPDGSISEIRVTRSLDLDLDQSAVAALRRWRFLPGLKDGQPMAVVVQVEMSFTLR